MNQQRIAQKLKVLKIIHLGLLTGLVVFFCVVSFVVYNNKVNDPQSAEIFEMVVPLLALMALMASRFIPKTVLNKIDPGTSLSDKLQRYNTAMIMRCAFIEGAALFSIVTYMITGDVLLQVLAAILIITLGIQHPTKSKIISDLKLDADQRQELLNG